MTLITISAVQIVIPNAPPVQMVPPAPPVSMINMTLQIPVTNNA